MVHAKRFLLMALLGIVGVWVYTLSRKVFLCSVHQRAISVGVLQHLERALSVALRILTNYPFGPVSDRKVRSRTGWPGGFVPEFLKRLPNTKNIDGLFQDCQALIGAASLEREELALSPNRVKIVSLLREIIAWTWRFTNRKKLVAAETVDLSFACETSPPQTVFVPELRLVGKNVCKAVSSQSPLNRPSPEFKTYEDCQIMRSGAVRSLDRLVLLHSSQSAANYFYVGSNEYRMDMNGRVLVEEELGSEASNYLSEAVYIYCRAGQNLYHWLMELMPVALEVPEHFDEKVPIVLRGPINTNFLNELTIIFGNRPVILTSENFGNIFAKKLHVRCAPVNTSDAFSPSFRGVISSFDYEAVERVRSYMLDRMAPGSFGYDKVFLTRGSSHRGLKNQARLKVIAEKRGFVAVDPGSLSIADQVSLFSRAHCLVGAGGGVMGNYLFASPGSRIGQLVSEQSLRFPGPSLICQISGATLFTGVGESKPAENFRNPLNWQHSGFEFSEADFVTLIDQMEL